MSYLDQLSEFESSLNSQHEQMSASIQGITQGIQNSFDEEYNKALESLEIAGGTISVGGMGIGGLHKTFKGLKAWNDKRLGLDEKGNADINLKGKGQVIEGKPITSAKGELPPNPLEGRRYLDTPLKEGDVKLQNAEEDQPLSLKERQQAKKTANPYDPTEDKNNENFEEPDLQARQKGEGQAPSLEERTATNDSIDKYNAGEGNINAETDAGQFMNDIEGYGLGNEIQTNDRALGSFNMGDDLVGGRGGGGLFDNINVSNKNGTKPYKAIYGEELPKNWGDDYITHSEKMVRKSQNFGDGASADYRGEGKVENLAPTTREGVERTKVSATTEMKPELTGDAITNEENEFYRPAGEGGAGRVRANTRPNFEDKVSYETYKPEIDNPAISITDEATLPEPAVLAQPVAPVAQPSLTNPASVEVGDAPLGDGSKVYTYEPDAPSIPQGSKAIETDIGLPQGSTAEGSGGYEALNSGFDNPGAKLNQGVADIKAGGNTAELGALGAEEGEASGLLGGLLGEGGGAVAGAEVAGAEGGIMATLGEMGAMGVASAGVGGLAPVLDVVGAGFMVAGLVKDLTEHPEKVPDNIVGGVSGKIGFDASAIGGDEKGGIGIM